MDLLSLPVVMIENIFSYLSYDEIAKKRLVSKAFNEICKRMLNRGFLMIERRHTLALKNVKAQLPRRESERRYHPLSRHSDILTSIETRISMLNMTYSKFIDNGLCCFIPGKVIDEIKRVLTIVETSATPPRAHEVLQELRDISSMAIEHFDDKISPEFRRRMQEGAVQVVRLPNPGGLAPLVIRQEMMHLRKKSALNVKLSLYLASRYKKFYGRMMDYKKLAMKQHRAIRHLTRKQKLQDAAITELKRRVEDLDIKYTELSLSVGGKSMGEVTPAPTQPLRHFSSQIKLDLSVLPIGTSNRNHNKLVPNMKPRKPLIKLPSLSEGDDEPPPKIQKIDNKEVTPTTSKSPFSVNMRDLAKELRQLNKITKNFENNLKRTMELRPDTTPDCKKQKID